MSLLIFFSVVFATIIFAIVLQRIIHCPILVGFAFFAAFLIVAAVFNSTTLVIVAIALGILAFIVAFLDCALRNSSFFRNNRCLRCDDDDDDDDDNCNCRRRRNSCRNNCNCDCENNSDDTFTILNSNGRVVARINGNNITCNSNNNSNSNGCRSGYNNGFNNSGVTLVSENSDIDDGNILTTADVSASNGVYDGRNGRGRRG